MNHYWFKPKRYGYGAVPWTWESWLSTLGCALLVILDLRFVPGQFLDPLTGGLAATLIMMVILAAFIWLARVKTEGGWRWRSGEYD